MENTYPNYQTDKPTFQPGIMQRIFNLAGSVIAGSLFLLVIVWLAVWIVKGFIALVSLFW